MSKTVFKYPLSMDMSHRIELSGPVVHAAMSSHGLPLVCLWAESGVQAPKARTFEVFGTGHDVPGTAKHIATVHDGIFVWHVYELEAAQ